MNPGCPRDYRLARLRISRTGMAILAVTAAGETVFIIKDRLSGESFAAMPF